MTTEHDGTILPAGNGTGPAEGDGDQTASGFGGQREILLGRTQQGQRWNPAQELIEIDPDPASYLPRTNITDGELSRNMRIKARFNRLTTGNTHLPEILAMFHIGRVGVDGRGMQSVIAIATGERVHQERMSGFGAGFASRAQGIDKEDVPASKGR